jgi:hypothetical protein
MFTTQLTHTQPKLLTPPQGIHPIGQLRKNPQKNTFQPLEVAENHSSTVGRQPAGKSAPLLDGNRHFYSPKIDSSARRKKIRASPRSTHISQISFSPILLLPSSSNPKWGSGGDAGLKERDGDEK